MKETLSFFSRIRFRSDVAPNWLWRTCDHHLPTFPFLTLRLTDRRRRRATERALAAVAAAAAVIAAVAAVAVCSSAPHVARPFDAYTHVRTQPALQ